MIRQLILSTLLPGLCIGPDVLAQPVPHVSSQRVAATDHPDDIFWDNRFTVGGPAGRIEGMVVDSDGRLLVGGAFITSGNQITDLVAGWDGASWTHVGDGAMSQDLLCDLCRWVKDLAVDGSGTVYAAGRKLLDDQSFAARLDGDSWLPLGSGNWSGEADALTVSAAGQVYAGGFFYGQREQARHYVLTWDGNDWAPLGDGVNGAVTALAPDGHGGIFVGGRFDSTAGISARRIAKWDGASWSSLVR